MLHVQFDQGRERYLGRTSWHTPWVRFEVQSRLDTLPRPEAEQRQPKAHSGEFDCTSVVDRTQSKQVIVDKL